MREGSLSEYVGQGIFGVTDVHSPGSPILVTCAGVNVIRRSAGGGSMIYMNGPEEPVYAVERVEVVLSRYEQARRIVPYFAETEADPAFV